MYIANWLAEQRQAKAADYIADTTLRRLKERSRLLDRFVPLKQKEGDEWLAYLTEQIDPIASLVSPGAEYPATRRGQFNQVQAKMFKAALRHEWSEDTQRQLKKIQELARAKNITIQNITAEDGKVLVGQDNSLAELIFGTLAALVRGHINLLDYLAWQVLQTGALVYNDPRTGLNINLDWKPAVKTQHNHFPAALTGARRWTEWETADPIQDLTDMAFFYKRDGAGNADAIAMSDRLVHQMLRCKSTKEAVVSSMTIGSVITGTVSVEQMNEVLRRRFLPPIEMVDDEFQLDGDNTGSSVATPMLDPTRVVFLKKGIAERVIGGTLENDGKTGIHQRTFEKSKEPPLDISVTASQMIVTAPMISKYGMSRQVTDTVALNAALNTTDFQW